MILLTYSTTGYNPMVEKYLLPSAGAFEVVRVTPDHPVAHWDTMLFDSICGGKVTAINEMASQLADGEVFVYCDGDVGFFGLTPEIVLHDLGEADIAAHAETPSKDRFCSGFLIFRCSPTVRKFCAEWMRLTVEASTEDQQWFNTLLGGKITCHYLSPEKYWSIGQAGLRYNGHSNQLDYIKTLVPRTTVMFHANCTVGLGHKMDLLEAVTKVVLQDCARV